MLIDPHNNKQYVKAKGLLQRGHILRLFDHSGNPSAFVTSGEMDNAPVRVPVEVAQQLISDGVASHATKGWNYDDYVITPSE